MTIRQESNVPELGRTTQTDLNRLLWRRSQGGPDFFAISYDQHGYKEPGAKKSSLKPGKNDKAKLQMDEFMDGSTGNGTDSDCAICMDSSRNSVLRPCNHMITCYDCSILLLNRQDSCPVCREKIDEVIRIFMS